MKKSKTIQASIIIVLIVSNVIISSNIFQLIIGDKRLDLNDFSASSNINDSQYNHLSKVFPLVKKNIFTFQNNTEINFTLTNTLDVSLNNFSLIYYHIKDSIEENFTNQKIFGDDKSIFVSTHFNDETRIIYNFIMNTNASLDPNETITLSSTFSINSLTSNLTGDGVYWECDESNFPDILYTIYDPNEEILDPIQNCATIDIDEDGISNSEELEVGTDPFIPNLWMKWISLDKNFKLESDTLKGLNILFGGQIQIGIPKIYENMPISMKITKLGLYTNILNVSLNSRIIIENLREINHIYILELHGKNGLQNVEFIVDNQDDSFDVEYDMEIKVGNYIPIDITGDSRDYDGDTILDINEEKNGVKWDDPDTDNDGVTDGYDIDPLSFDIYEANTLKSYKIPLLSNNSYTSISIQLKPTSYDYSIQDFPFGNDKLKITPALRVYGNNPAGSDFVNGDVLPNSSINLENKLGFIPLYELKDQKTGNLLCYMASFDYKIDNLAQEDHFIDLKFEIVWIASKIYDNGSETILHAFDVQQNFTIEGFKVSEIHVIDIFVALVDDGLDLEKTKRFTPIVAALSNLHSFAALQDRIYSLDDIPDIHYKNMTIRDPSLINSTIRQLETIICNELGIDSAIERKYIVVKNTGQTSYSWDALKLVLTLIEHGEDIQEILEQLKGIIIILSIIHIASDLTILFSTAVIALIDTSFFLAYWGVHNGISSLGLHVSRFDLFRRLCPNIYTEVEHGSFFSAGSKFAKLGKILSAIDLVVGFLMVVSSFQLFAEGYYSTATKELVVGILLIAAGVAGILAETIVGAVVAVVLALAALVVELVWDWIAALFHLEDPNPDFDVSFEDDLRIARSPLLMNLSPQSGLGITVSNRLDVKGNVDFKFKSQLRLGSGSWGPLVETGRLSPGQSTTMRASDTCDSYGPMVNAEYYFATYDYHNNKWTSKIIDIPLNLIVYPNDIESFWQKVFEGSWITDATPNLILTPKDQNGTGGDTLEYNVNIKNPLSQYQQYYLSVFTEYGIPEITQVTPLVLPKSSINVPLRIHIPKNYTSTPYQHLMILSAQSTSIPDARSFCKAYYTIQPFYYFNTSISQDMVEIKPGSVGSYDISILNLGNVGDTYNLSIDTSNPEWFEFSNNHISLGPGHSNLLTLNVSIPYSWNIAPGIYPFTIKIASQTNSEVFNVIQAFFNISVFFDLDLLLIPIQSEITPNHKGIFKIQIQNLGNIKEVFDISIYYFNFGSIYEGYPSILQENWIKIDQSSAILDPGQITTACLEITIPPDWCSMENVTYSFNISVMCRNQQNVFKNTTGVLKVCSTPESMMRYIILQLNWLHGSIEQYSNNTCVTYEILKQIDFITCLLNNSLIKLVSGQIQVSVIYNWLSLIKFDNLYMFIKNLNWLNIYPESISKIFLKQITEIKENVVVSMGAIIGTRVAMQISYLLVQIYRLSIGVSENYSFPVSMAINAHLNSIFNNLNEAIFFLLFDFNSLAQMHILAAIHIMDHLKMVVFSLEKIGCISLKEKQYFSNEIDGFLLLSHQILLETLYQYN